MQGGNDEAGKRILRGWKEIAVWLGKDESTAKRWASKRGLPVHRVPGQPRASVYAYPEEITFWLTRQKQSSKIEPAIKPTETVPPEAALATSTRILDAGGTRRWMVGVALAAAFAVAVPATLALTRQGQGNWSVDTGGYRPSDRVRNLYLDGVYLYEKRTPESLKLAASSLQQAVDLDPHFAGPYAALAVTYDLMVEYQILAAEDGYAKSKIAAEKALQLDPNEAEAHAALGDITFYQFKDYQRGLDYFSQSVALNPASSLSHHWYASALMSSGRYADALREIELAQSLEPTSRSVLVSKAMIFIGDHNITAAERILSQLVANEPGYRSPYRFLSFLALAQGDYQAYLAALRKRFEITQDKAGLLITEAGERGYRVGGAQALAKAMVEAAMTEPQAETVEPYFLAHILSLSGDFDGAAAQLSKVMTRHAFYYGFDPAFESARSDPSFVKQIRTIGLPVIR